MTDTKRNLLVGLFVLGGLACLGVLIVMFGESRGLFGKRYTVTAKFERIVGVREGTDVTLAGVWVGSVLGIRMVDATKPNEGINVVLDIDPQFSIPAGSVALVETPLMGQPTINIQPPGETIKLLPQDGKGEIHGVVKGPLESVIDPKFMAAIEKTTTHVGLLAEALTPAAKAIQDLLEQRTISQVEASAETPQQIAANLYTTIERLHSVLKHFDVVLGDPTVQSNVRDTLANFKAASEEAHKATESLKLFGEEARKTAVGARQIIGKVDATVDTSHQIVKDLGQKLLTTTDQLSRLLDYLNSAGRDIAEGQGTMGMVLRDPHLYDELMLTVKRLGDAATEMQVLIKQWQKQGILSGAK
ncbi:MAG TPA: MlaD family protein [Phycisphaerae bacterium]|nr:MlaD family protein [Phycisphaerae bacterium]